MNREDNPHLKGTNPILPIDFCIPDVEAHAFSDGRLYLYGSCDIKGQEKYCSTVHHGFSTDNMRDFVHHGKIIDRETDATWSSGVLFAPDAIEKNGKFYLYICTSDRKEGVAVSESPAGPFIHAKEITDMEGIDPAVFVDDDGQGYIYWGQGNQVKAAKLTDDMTGIIADSIVQPLSNEEHFFHEGSSMRKRNGTYYYVFADESRRCNKATCLGYATSESPLGPFTYRGVILDNYGCDPNVWNNHGSIECFNDQWFVFYHRSTRNERYSRRVCVEKIEFTEDGLIPEVKMTSQGAAPAIPASVEIPAYLACELSGRCYFDEGADGSEALVNIHNGDSAIFRTLEFSSSLTKAELKLRLFGMLGIEVYQGCKCIGSVTRAGTDLNLAAPGANNDRAQGVDTIVYIDIDCEAGIHELTLKFYGLGNGVFAELKSIRFQEENPECIQKKL